MKQISDSELKAVRANIMDIVYNEEIYAPERHELVQQTLDILDRIAASEPVRELYNKLLQEQLKYEQDTIREAHKALDALSAPTNGEQGIGKHGTLSLAQRIATIKYPSTTPKEFSVSPVQIPRTDENVARMSKVLMATRYIDVPSVAITECNKILMGE